MAIIAKAVMVLEEKTIAEIRNICSESIGVNGSVIAQAEVRRVILQGAEAFGGVVS